MKSKWTKNYGNSIPRFSLFIVLIFNVNVIVYFNTWFNWKKDNYNAFKDTSSCGMGGIFSLTKSDNYLNLHIGNLKKKCWKPVFDEKQLFESIMVVEKQVLNTGF